MRQGLSSFFSSLLVWALVVIATAGTGFGFASLAIGARNYGWSLFVGVPYFIGFFSSAILRYRGVASLRACLGVATVTGATLAFLFLGFGREGVVCLLMTLVLALPLMILGAWTGYMLLHRRSTTKPLGPVICSIVALGLTTWAEDRSDRSAPIYTVTDTITISAPVDVVWRALVTLGELGRPTDPLFRLGVACPIRVDIYGDGVGALRVCTLTTGLLEERITAWRPSRELAWVSVSTPPPLRELNPFVTVDPPHLHGFYRSVNGRFALRALGPHTTVVTRQSTYQHNLYPAAYWRVWCDYVAKSGHKHVLKVLKTLAEGSGAAV